jgi:hypothetical protein
MVSNDHTAMNRDILGDCPPVVPLFVESGSSSEMVIQSLRRVFKASDFAPLLQEVATPVEAESMLVKPEFATTIHPFSKWENQAVFYVRVCGSVDDLFLYEDSALLPINVLLGKIPTDSNSLEMPARGVTFALDPDLPAATSLKRLSDVLAYYLFSSWFQYWHSRKANMHEAFALTGTGRFFYLGVSWVGPHWDDSIMRSKAAVIEELHRRWKAPERRVQNSPYPDFKTLIETAAPEQGYLITDGVTGNPHVEIHNGDAKRGIKMIERLRRSKNLSWERRLGEIIDTGHYVAIFLTRNATRWADNALRSCFRKSRSVLEDYCDPFQAKSRDEACLSAIGQRIDYANQSLDALDKCYVEDCYKIRKLEENISILRKRILSLPNLRSACLRVGLIGVGCAWLFFGGMVWMDGGFTELDYATRMQMAWGIGAAYFLMVALLIGRWVYYRFGIMRAEDLCERDICASAARELAEKITKISKQKAVEARRDLKIKLEELSELKQKLRDDLFSECKAEAGVEDPRFPANKLHQFFQTHFNPSVDESMNDFLDSMAQKEFSLCAEEWIATANSAVTASLGRIAAQTSIEELADFCALSTRDRQHLVKETVSNARQILVADAPHNRLGALVFLTSDWEIHRGGNDTTILRDDPSPRNGLMGVCALPLEDLLQSTNLASPK